MTKTFCDLCGREVGIKKYALPYYDVKIVENRGIPLASFDIATDIEMDICIYCQNKIREFLRWTNFKENKNEN